MKKYMPLEGLRWSRDSGSTLCDTPQNGRSRTGWGGEQEKKYVELVYHTTTSYNFLSPITTSCKPGCLFLLKQKLSI